MCGAGPLAAMALGFEFGHYRLEMTYLPTLTQYQHYYLYPYLFISRKRTLLAVEGGFNRLKISQIMGNSHPYSQLQDFGCGSELVDFMALPL